MKSARFGVAVFAAGIAVALGLFAYVVDHLRATTLVVSGLGDAAEPEREAALEVPSSAEAGLDETESARRSPVSPEPRPLSGFEIHVTDEAGRELDGKEVLAYRGTDLVRAGRTEHGGLARLIPFDGPAEIAVEIHGLEFARETVADGHGHREIVVPRGLAVAGIVLVDGSPCAGVDLWLDDARDGWLAVRIARGLEHLGLAEPHSPRLAESGPDGRFRFDWLTADWSGVLIPGAGSRLVGGARRVELAHPEEGLVLELESVAPELAIRGRVVFEGRPVPGAKYEYSLSSAYQHRRSGDPESFGRSGSEACDARGCFSLERESDPVVWLKLEFLVPGVGAREIELSEGEIHDDLGDIELLPTRSLAFVARDESGRPIAGIRGRPLGDPRLQRDPSTWHPSFRAWTRCSEPTDAEGRGVLEGLEPRHVTARFSGIGYAAADVAVPQAIDGPLEVVLARSASFDVVVRGRDGRIPPGICVRIEARTKPFTWSKGYYAENDEQTPDTPVPVRWGREGEGYSGNFALDARGRAWIDALRPGEPCDLAAVDGYGSVVAEARGLVPASGEWRRVELRVETEPRTLLVVVRDTLGHPLSSASLGIAPSGKPGPSSWTLRTDRAGMGRTEPLYANDVTVEVSREGFESRTIEHVAVPREGATLEVRLAHEWLRW